MEFQDKYISETDNAVTPDPKKIVITDEAFAVGDEISQLRKEIKHLKSLI